MSLSPEDKARIEAEERARFAEEAERERVRAQIRAEAADEEAEGKRALRTKLIEAADEEKRTKKLAKRKQLKKRLICFLLIFIPLVVLITIPAIGGDGTPPTIKSTSQNAPESSSGRRTINNNLDAASLVKIGMNTEEFFGLIGAPMPPMQVVYLDVADASMPWSISVAGKQLGPVQDPDKWTNSPYVVSIFYPTFSGSSQPTFVFRDTVGDRVIEVSRHSCDRTKSLIMTSNQDFVGTPKGSACR